uniref:transposase n=1 Tax=Serratia liquefaciens TaxID=614 RepID=UPI001F1A18B3|nr:transposase [Serratia liquefaciens]
MVHQYYDHRTQHKRQKISQEEMLQRYVSHIPSRHFKMVWPIANGARCCRRSTTRWR